MKRENKHNFIFSLTVGLFALMLRLWNVISIGDNFYANFLSDASTFMLWASKIAIGGAPVEPVFPMGPLYPYFLALNLKLGFSFYTVLFIQAFLGAIVVVLVGLIASRLFGRSAGYVSGILAALYAPFIFYDGLLLSESLQIFLLTLALFFLIPTKGRKPEVFQSFIAGLFIGSTALGRGTILLFPTFLIAYWLINSYILKKGKLKPQMIRSGLLVIGTVIGILPATIHNLSHGEFVPISSNSGINFYIGNNAYSTGAYKEPQGLNLASDFTGRKIAERQSGQRLRSSEVSAFWMAQTWKYISENPGSFLAGLLKKGYLYFWYFDIPQAESIQIQGKFSWLFELPLIGFGAILVLGVAGIIFGRIDERLSVLIILFLSSIFAVMIFFVIGRFRLLGSLALLISSGGGAVAAYRIFRERNWNQILKILILVAVLGAILFLPRPIDRKGKIASALDNVGIFHYHMHHPEKAIGWYRLALDELPNHAAALHNIGAYFYTKGNVDSARYYFHGSIESDSMSDAFKTYQNLGRIAGEIGDLDSAYYYYQKAKSVAPFGLDAEYALRELEIQRSDSIGDQIPEGSWSFDVLFNMAERFAAQGRFIDAEEYYRKALRIQPDDIRALNNLGIACRAQMKFEAASDMFQRLIEITGGNAIAYNNLASVVYKMGRVDSAIVLWEMALKYDPDNPQITKNLKHVRKTENR